MKLVNKCHSKTIHNLSLIFLLGIIFSAAGLSGEIIQPGVKHDSAVAIFSDQLTFDKIEDAIFAYKKSIEQDGLSVYLVVENWKNPEEIKKIIQHLYEASPAVEGAVFVGDIPVPMLRDAQHLTSAFKMDQDNPARFPFIDSSIPSDRFYDDFDLKFDFIRQDGKEPLLFYYSLSWDSPQRVKREIYSGRIKSTLTGAEKYDQLKKYLHRISAQKGESHELNKMLLVTGHGYHSESLTAWANELVALREQFPELYQPGGSIDTYYHLMGNDLKDKIFSKLQNSSLDFVLFHAHGDDDMQYLLGQPITDNINEDVDAIKYFLRSKLRSAKRRNRSLEETKRYYIEKYGVPDAWFAGAFSDSLIKADSIVNRQLDIYVEDVRSISPQPRLIMFDECFNGAFIRAPYIAGEYVLGSGKTITAVANSVNVLQDIRADEFLGLLGRGIRVGAWHQTRNYLESHIIGDPTFRFRNNFDFSELPVLNKKQFSGTEIENLITHENPQIRAYGYHQLLEKEGKKAENKIISTYHEESSFIVRLEVLKCLASLRSAGFENLLLESVDDPYEMIRRYSVQLMGDIGKKEFLEPLLVRLISETGKRVQTSIFSTLQKINSQEAFKTADNLYSKYPDSDYKRNILGRLARSAKRNREWLEDELLPTIKNDTLDLKKRIRSVRTFRNYRFSDAVLPLLKIVGSEEPDAKLKISILEALGWFVYNHQRQEIINQCEKLISDGSIPALVKQEAEKTRRRLLTGANYPLTP